MNADATLLRARWKDSLGQAIASCHDRQRQDVRAVVELARRYGTPAPAILPMVRASLDRMDRDAERRAWMAKVESEIGNLTEAEAAALIAPVAVLAANRSWYLSDADVLNLINDKA